MLLILVYSFFTCGANSLPNSDIVSPNDDFLSVIDRELEVFDHFHEYALRTFNQTCNNLGAAAECADACDNALWDCLDECMQEGDVSDMVLFSLNI